jgi:beta-mannanase
MIRRREVLTGFLGAALAPAAAALLPAAGSVDQVRAQTTLGGKYPRPKTPGLVLGAYDPHGDFKDFTSSKIEHLFLPWQDVDLSTLNDADDYARARGRSIMITVEPWSWVKERRTLRPQELRDGILSGRFDGTIETIAKAIDGMKSDVTFRWAQEMEDPDGRFTWQGWAPNDYIAAYRRVVDITRRFARRTKFIWSPKGLKNLVAYYPGGGYADVVGLSVFGLQKQDQDSFGRNRTFAELLKPGYDLASTFGKQVYVAELGYDGDANYNESWANAVDDINPNFSQLVAVVYFNDKEVHPWPAPYGLPNWRVV